MNREQKAILAPTPGHILQTEFLDGFHLTQMELSKVSPARANACYSGLVLTM